MVKARRSDPVDLSLLAPTLLRSRLLAGPSHREVALGHAPHGPEPGGVLDQRSSVVHLEEAM